MLRNSRAVLTLALLTSTACAAPAHAGQGTTLGFFGEVEFVDTGGNETNNVTLQLVGSQVHITDSTGPTITAGGACSKPGGFDYATCPYIGLETFGANLHGGNDRFTGGGGVHRPLIVSGGAGQDELIGSDRNDRLFGEGDNDMLIGGPGNDSLTDEGLAVSGGHDQFFGGDGSDWLDGGKQGGTTATGFGADILDGGIESFGTDSTIDTVTYEQRTTPLIITQDNVGNDGQAGESDNVRNVEIVIGGSGGDSITGGTTAETFYGAAGGDTLRGGAGADTLNGGTSTSGDNSGDDSLDGGAGADRLFGGDGNDVATYGTRTAPITVVLDNLANDGEAGEGDRIYPDVERVEGGSGADNFTGSGDANTLTGAAGADTLNGLGGDDTIAGGADGDTIDPGTGNDNITAGEGDDVVNARDGGTDTISCEGGTDSVVADAADNVAADCENVDRPPVAQEPGKTDDNNNGNNQNPPPPPPPPGDTTAPKVVLSPTKLKLTKKGEAVVTITCPAAETGGCSGSATLEALASKKPKVKKQTLGKKTWKATAGQQLKVTIKLSAKARALIKKHKKVKSRLSVIARDTAGNTAPAVTRSILVQRR
jgi:Ca2+-binding RTX toxin-like protein